jgi:hypothetical protein
MNANAAATRLVGRVLTLTLIMLTLATGYVHLSLGGTIFTLNGIGYLIFAAGLVGSTLPLAFIRPLRWLPRIGVAGFAVVTIGAYLVIGPYSLLGLSTKAIEVAIIGLVGADLINTLGSSDRLSRIRVAQVERPSGSPVQGEAA